MIVLDRRAFFGRLARLSASAAGLVLLDGCRLFLPPATQPAKLPRLGYLGDPPDTLWASALWDSLSELGWVEGQSISIERRTGQLEGLSDSETLPLVAELLVLPVDVLVCVGTASTLAAKRATSTTPIVFFSVSDPVGSGVVTNLARPGGNFTGVSNGASTPFNAKHLELLKDVVRGFTRVAYLVGPGTSGLALAQIQEAARVLSVQVQTLDVRDFGSADDLASAFATAARWPADGVIVPGAFVPYRGLVVDFAARSHMPAIYPYEEFVDAGGLMSYGTSATSSSRHAATYVDKILRGARPADLPVEQLTTLEFAVNLKTAEALGITFPPDVAAQVTAWIQ